MPIAEADLVLHSSANIPDDDTSTAGGAIDTASRPSLVQFSAPAVAAIISDGADTRAVTVVGRLESGAIDTDVLTADGTNEVVGAKTFERILRVTTSSNGSRTISVRQGSGGTVRGTLPPNTTKLHIAFQRSASAPSERVRYEKHFYRNAHGTLALLGAAVTLTADAAEKIHIGLAPSAGDSATVANRLTAPGSVSFVDDGVAQNIPGGDLAAGVGIGVWARQTLDANDAPQKSTFTIQLAGSTT